MVIGQSDYFVPSLVPDNRPETIADFFSKLCIAVQTTASKLDIAIPSWVNEFEFDAEEKIRTEVESLEEQIKECVGELNRLERYKGILTWSGDQLVIGVADVFKTGFGFAIDTIDEFKEDLKLLDTEGEPWCICEIKGVNRGVKREHINQTDSHRERSGFSDDFPSLLISNVSMRAEQSISSRDAPIANEQIRHAKSMNVLVVRYY